MLTKRSFVLAGNATFTVKSLATGKHFTFKVQKPDENTPAFVKVLTGDDNENDFSVLGTIFKDGNYRHNAKNHRSHPMRLAQKDSRGCGKTLTRKR